MLRRMAGRPAFVSQRDIRLEEFEKTLRVFAFGVEAVFRGSEDTERKSIILAFPANRRLKEELAALSESQCVSGVMTHGGVISTAPEMAPKRGDLVRVLAAHDFTTGNRPAVNAFRDARNRGVRFSKRHDLNLIHLG